MWVALLGGPLGILLSVVLSVGVGSLLGWPLPQSMVIGTIVSVASTMVLARLLVDRGDLHAPHGRVMIGITLIEDLAVVVLTFVLGAVGLLEPDRLLAVGRALLVDLAILAPFTYVAAKLVPPLMRRVAATRNDELFLIVALARLLPVRGVFVALFFVTVGALIDPGTILRNLPLLGAMLGLIVIGKLAVWTAVVALFGYPISTALLVGVGLTQIGEFSFILVQVARTAGHVGDDVYNATLTHETDTPTARDHVVLCGFGRVGSAVGDALATFGIPFTVVERDPDLVRDLRRRDGHAVFGDAGHAEILRPAGAAHAALVIVALPEMEASATVIRHALARLRKPSEQARADLQRFRDAMATGHEGVEPATLTLPEVREVHIGGGALADRSLREAAIRERFGVTVVSIARADETVVNPPPETFLREGDVVRVFGKPEQVATFAGAAGRPS